MKPKRLILLVLTILSLVPVLFALIGSSNEPQVQSQLQLYQTDLILHASEFKVDNIGDLSSETNSDLSPLRNSLIGADPFLTAQNQYLDAKKASQTNLANLQAQLEKISTPDLARQTPSFVELQDLTNQKQIERKIEQEKSFIRELDLKLGIIQAERLDIPIALQTWENLISKKENLEAQTSLISTAKVLRGLWSTPLDLLPNAETTIEENLDSWFRYRALRQLYQVENRQQDLANLQEKEREIASQAIVKLTLIGTIPLLGGLIGFGILIFLLIQLFTKGERSLLNLKTLQAWETPWDGETIWQVLIVGFFFVGQIVLPLVFSLLGISAIDLSLRMKAAYVLVSYLLMAAGGFLVLFLSIKPFFPLPKDWFRFDWWRKWFVWGGGGYLVAIPLVVLVSLVNQLFWQGQGGSNPLLFLALEAQDKVVLAIFFFTASVAAPIFEEIMFRGFLLPSLTRYLPVWGAIVVSSLVFALAHLSLSEVLPLATLGIILGVVYARSRNLLASILLHSLWNSGTLLSLFVLGSRVG